MLLRFIAIVLVVTVVSGYYECQPGTVDLDLSYTDLGPFPNLSACASSLRRLYLTGTGLVSIPPQISELEYLIELTVNDNQLTALPTEIGSLHNLRRLLSSGNSISDLPPSFSNLVGLEALHLSRNNFRHVPSVLLSLNLHELHMNNNSISRLPPALGNMHNMRDVQLSHNPIVSIPAELGGWWGLQTFVILETPVQCLPRSVKRIRNGVNGNHFPACTNDTIAGYVVQRALREGICDGEGM
jgi:Leucine-rich repeat (LRR) protein